jgi:F-type H+-transporting ATPase subunit b
VLELNYWFFVLVANFLVLTYILNRILFAPLLKLFREREEAISGRLMAARGMTEDREARLEELKREMAAASARARDAFDALKQEGLERQRELLKKTGDEASALVEKAREEIRAESDRARQSLRKDVETFSEDIVSKLIGVRA